MTEREMVLKQLYKVGECENSSELHESLPLDTQPEDPMPFHNAFDELLAEGFIECIEEEDSFVLTLAGEEVVRRISQ